MDVGFIVDVAFVVEDLSLRDRSTSSEWRVAAKVGCRLPAETRGNIIRIFFVGRGPAAMSKYRETVEKIDTRP